MIKESRNFHYHLIILCLVFILFVIGCSNEQTVEERTLRIDGQTRSVDTTLFESAHPDIKIEQTTRPHDGTMDGYQSVERLKELLEGPTPPDVLVLDFSDYVELMEGGWLAPYDPLLSASEALSEDDFLPAIVDMLRGGGDGQLYGMTPTFQSSALIYNKQLFQEAGVPEPEEEMNWDELFSIARQVMSDDASSRIYGFNFRGSYLAPRIADIVQYYTASLGLPITNEQHGEMLVNTPDWKQALEQIVQLYEENVLPGHAERGLFNPYGSVENNAFLSGELAMSIMSYGELVSLMSTNEQAELIKDFEPIDYGVAPLPHHANVQNVRADVVPGQVFAIHANAENMEDAWRYIEFVMQQSGELYARARTIPTLRSLADQKSMSLPFDLSLFYPIDGQVSLPETTDMEIIMEGSEPLMRVFAHKITVEDALRQWETAGNRILQQRN